MILLIDDFRNLSVDVIARTAEAGKRMLLLSWDELLLDHNLGCGETGYDLLVWALYKDMVLPPKITLVTHDREGREAMEELLQQHGYIKYKGSFINTIELAK